MPTVLRAQVVLKHVSGLPRDHVSNTFWFDAVGDGSASQAEDVAELLVTLYTSVTSGPDGTGIFSFLSTAIATNGHEVRVAPIDVATGVDERGLGFPPLHTEVFDLVGRPEPGPSLPSEVAACLSFKNMSSGAVPPARRRGRVYFGPLEVQASLSDGGVPRPSATLQRTLREFGVLLRNMSADVGVLLPWVVYSRPYEGRAETPRPGNPRGPLPALPARPGAIYPVTDVWVDNAFDTQRKRGEDATARLIGAP